MQRLIVEDTVWIMQSSCDTQSYICLKKVIVIINSLISLLLIWKQSQNMFTVLHLSVSEEQEAHLHASNVCYCGLPWNCLLLYVEPPLHLHQTSSKHRYATVRRVIVFLSRFSTSF